MEYRTSGTFNGRSMTYEILEGRVPDFSEFESVKMPYVGTISYGKVDNNHAVVRPFYFDKFNGDSTCIFDSELDAKAAFSYWTDCSDLYHLT